MITVNQTINDYLAEHIHTSCVAIDRAEYAAKALVSGLGSIPVTELNRTLIASYGKERGVSPGTLRRELGVLIAAINHAVRERRLRADEAPYIPLPAEPAPKDRWMDRDEAERLLAAATGRCLLFIQIGLHTAARKAAIEGLRWEQVDLTRRIIDFNPVGRKQTKKRRPVVPISDTLMQVLTQIDRKTEWVLGHPGNIRKAFHTAAVKAGLADVTPHTLRHTWATWAAQRGVVLWEIAGVLGDTMVTVEKKYAHHHPDYLRSAIE